LKVNEEIFLLDFMLLYIYIKKILMLKIIEQLKNDATNR